MELHDFCSKVISTSDSVAAACSVYSWAPSGHIDIAISDFGFVENVRVALGVARRHLFRSSVISASGLVAAVLSAGCWAMSTMSII